LKENFDRFNNAIHKEKEMADFRRGITALAVLVLILGLASTASAQGPLSCFASASGTPTVRQEGLTELVGDLVLNCTGGTPTALTSPATPVPQVNVQVFLNTNITSRLLADPWSETLLLIDEPGVTPTGNAQLEPSGNPQLVCTDASGVCSIAGNGTGINQYNGTAGHPNVFQGRKAPGRDDSIVFLGIPIDPPGTQGNRIIRITNIRANANGVGASAIGPSQILEFVSTTPGPVLPINNPQQIVAFVQKGLDFTVQKFNQSTSSSSTIDSGGVSKQHCSNARQTNSSGQIAALRYTELFPSAFKKRSPAVSPTDADGALAPPPLDQHVPGQFLLNNNNDSGLYNPAFPTAIARSDGTTSNLSLAGLADFGTRVKAVFNNVPAGVRLWVDIVGASTNGNKARLTTTEAGGFFNVPASDTLTNKAAELAVVGATATTGGTATAVWEIVDNDPTLIGLVQFNVYIRYDANPGAGSPALGTSTVVGSFAPISTKTNAGDFSAPIPRFAGPGVSKNLFLIRACVTNLLFPFVTNQAGFDTGLAIANTSTDPFGTSPQQGKCTLNSYGDKQQGPIDTPVVNSGTVYTALASDPTKLPGFQGYVIAVCQFQYAHGFAFISDLGARNLAMGYLALIIPDPARNADPLSKADSGSGENIAH